MPAARRLRPMSALQILGAALRLWREHLVLFSSLAAIGVAPLVASVLALHHAAVVRGLAREGAGSQLLPWFVLVAATLFWRVLLQAAILRGLGAVLEGRTPGPATCLREVAPRWREILVVGGAVTVLGLASGLAYFIPVVLLGGLVVLALPRVVLDETAPGAALAGPGRSTGKALWVNLFFFALAGVLWGNLHLLAHLVLALGHSFFDLDVGYLNTVLSLENPVYVLALVLASFALLEPARVLGAGLLHLEEKVRREGLDLVERIEALRRPRRRGAPRAAALLLAGLGLILGGPTGATAVAAPSGRAAVTGSATDAAREAAAALGADLASGEGGFPRLKRLIRARQRKAGTSRELWKALDARLRALPPTSPKRDRAVVASALAGSILRELGGAATDPRRLLRRVLARDEFQGLDASAWKRPPTPAPEPEVELPRLRLGRGAGGGLSGFGVLAVILALAALGVVGTLAYLGFRARRRRRRAEEPRGDEQTPEHVGEDALAREPDEWRAEADRLAARGEHREALRHVYLSLLVGLHRARAIEYERWRTNWDYQRAMRAPAAARGLFGELTRTFDLVWYGQRAVAPETYDDFARHADRLVATVVAPAEAG